MFKLINYTTTDALNEIAKAYGLKVKGSCGAGTWTRYPWIAIYNEKITTTIQRGVYIVYLFSEDMSRVYLTLNQGCTNLKKDLGTKGAREAMITTREMIRNALNYAQFNTDNDLSKFHNFKPLILLNFFSKQKGFHPINVEYIK